ncbi:peptidoglycan DD-metalloendopeptidase family protein [Deinococcus cellulosilyticus]|uniref:M23ase beta-sheet core domain-containing protein n=1 Tax=Deinococcus cellulosilyticus (strain DSM 18568 / NBRC 106333 / KACC 11606 / 5516J-15) TaxID=1223518 RepID=A0A511NAI7_DEIC1|nr:peptidoglycan DD-metalloendopeptidase family protein [Deinococcus cellulosilyticus]GEM49556.1 hypothetical protein DC3_51910 [Deinococcus cellulosilyticus NBRC 106333 = KACC 11606]
MTHQRFLLLCLALGAHALAHSGAPLKDSQLPKPAQQFGLPFASPPGPASWLLGQVYGNTTGAYRQRNSTYRAGQGIHFGLDFSAACGTPVVAIGDGVVQDVDGPHGSPPHNLIIDHGNGLASFYGHLQKRPSLKVGQRVKKGQVVGLSGDSQFTCRSAPHLHLEIRDTSHMRFFNPIPYIKADWDTLFVQGGFSRGFQRDLANIRKWQHPEDQPQAFRGGALLNRFALSWPPDEPQDTPQQGKFSGYRPVKTSWPEKDTRITTGGCCVLPVFTPDSRQLMFIDRPSSQSPVGWYGVRPGQKPQAMLPLGFYSPDLRHQVLPSTPAGTRIKRLTDGKTVTLSGEVGNVLWSPQGSRFVWNESQNTGNFDERQTRIRISAFGQTPRTLATVYGGGAQGFLDEETLLVLGKTDPKSDNRTLYTLDLKSGKTRKLETALNIRGVAISPKGSWIAYFLAFNKDRKNGLFVVNRDGRKLQVPGFGSYRWRDDDTLLTVPLRDTSGAHTVYRWTVGQKDMKELVRLSGKISYDQWTISPDGQNLAYVSGKDRNIYGLKLP